MRSHLGTLGALLVLVIGTGGVSVEADPASGAAATRVRRKQLMGAAAADAALGPFIAHLTYDLEVSVAGDGAVSARVLDVRRCEDDGSGLCLSDREGNGTTSIAWNFQRARLWAEVPPGGVTAYTEGPSPRVEAQVVVHLEGMGNRHTAPDWLGERMPAHGPGIAVTGEVTYRAAEHTFTFAEFPALRSVPKTAFRPGAPDAGSTVKGYTLDEPCMHTHIHRLVGQAQVLRTHGGALEPARVGMSLEPGDLLKSVGADDLVDVVVAPGHLVRLEGVTTLRIDPDSFPVRISYLELVTGVLWAKARKGDDSLKVATPNAICGVRGTAFRVTVLAGAEPMTCVEVEEGAVETTAKDGQDTKQTLTPADGKVCLLGVRGFLRAPTQPLAPPGAPAQPPPASGPAAVASEITLDFPKGGESQDAVVAPGGSVTVNAETHGGTGATWSAAHPPAAGEAMLTSGPELVPGRSTGRLGGGGGQTRWRYRVTAPAGSAFSLVFELRQPWNPKPLSTYTARIQVGSPALRLPRTEPGAGAGPVDAVTVTLDGATSAWGVYVRPGATIEVRLKPTTAVAGGTWSMDPAPPAGALTLVDGPKAQADGSAIVRLRASGVPSDFLIGFAYRAAGAPAVAQRVHLGVAVASPAGR